MRSGASEVYVHGMPGGPVHQPARAGALARHRRHALAEVARAYAQVNEMFGDIVKVTPSSKVVGDMAIMMVTSGLSRAAT
jgi:pyruvate carboxylase